MKELFFDVRRNWQFYGSRLLLLVFGTLLVFHACSFVYSADRAIQQSLSSESEMNLYRLVDTLTDPAEFTMFRESSQSIETVGQFYNVLNEHDRFRFLSIFNQQIPIKNFKGDERFDGSASIGLPSSETYPDPETGEATRDIASFQMNQNAFEFYRLTIASGKEPDWSEINYASGTTPVLLGANYQGVYQLGDTLQGSLYFEPMQFTVVGFLTEASSVFFQGDINTYLDNSLVVPYPAKLGKVTPDTQFLSGILFFAMANGDIAVPQETNEPELLAQLQSIGDRSGFHQYTLIGMPSYLIQLQLMRALIVDNSVLITGLITVNLVILTVTFISLGTILRRRRFQTYLVRHHVGTPVPALRNTYLRSQSAQTILSLFIVITVFATMPNPTILGYAAGIGTVLTVSTIDAVLQMRQLTSSLRKGTT